MTKTKSRPRPNSTSLISDLQFLAYDHAAKTETPAEEFEKLCKELSLYVTSDESDSDLFAKALAGDDEAFQKIEADNEQDLCLETPSKINFSLEYDLNSPTIGRMVAIVVARELKIDSDEFDSPTPPTPPVEPERTGWRWQAD